MNIKCFGKCFAKIQNPANTEIIAQLKAYFDTFIFSHSTD